MLVSREKERPLTTAGHSGEKQCRLIWPSHPCPRALWNLSPSGPVLKEVQEGGCHTLICLRPPGNTWGAQYSLVELCSKVNSTC